WTGCVSCTASPGPPGNGSDPKSTNPAFETGATLCELANLRLPRRASYFAGRASPAKGACERYSVGLTRVQRLNARVNALCCEKPKVNAMSVIDRLASSI